MNKLNRESWFSQQRLAVDSKKTNQALLNKVITRLYEIPTLKIGPRRFHYLYSAVLPQVHLTLVSILQGIAFGVLLLGIPLKNFSLEFFLQQYFYLPYLTASLGILIIWKQFVYASMCRNWPASTTQVILIYLLAVAEIIVFRVLAIDSDPSKPLLSEKVPIWLVSVASITIFGGSIRLNDLRIENDEDFENEQVGKLSRAGDKSNGLAYIGIGIVLIILTIYYNGVIYVAKLVFHDASIIPWIVYAALFVMTCCVLKLDTVHRRVFIKELVDGSDLIVSKHGVLRYKDEKKPVMKDSLTPQPKTSGKQMSQEGVVQTQAHQLIAEKFYRYCSISFLSIIIGGVAVLLLSRNVPRKRH